MRNHYVVFMIELSNYGPLILVMIIDEEKENQATTFQEITSSLPKYPKQRLLHVNLINLILIKNKVKKIY